MNADILSILTFDFDNTVVYYEGTEDAEQNNAKVMPDGITVHSTVPQNATDNEIVYWRMME